MLFRNLLVIAATALTCSLAVGTASAQNAAASPSSTMQPLIAYAYTTTCVVAGEHKTVFFHFQNTGNKSEHIILRLYGASDTTDDVAYKGPVNVVDALHSGLFRTATDATLRWSFELGAGLSIDKPVYLTVPADSMATTPWDPAWGRRPASQFYLGGTANVRFSSAVQYPGVQPYYCK